MMNFRNDITSGDRSIDGVSGSNLSSGVVYALNEELSSEKDSAEDFYEEEEELGPDDEPGEIAVISEITPSNVSVASTINSTANDSAAVEEDIPSFSEWTQKVLAEEEKSGNQFFFAK